MFVVDVSNEILLIIHLIVTEETLVEFANAVMCSKVLRHFRQLLITMLAFDSWRRSAIWIYCACENVTFHVTIMCS